MSLSDSSSSDGFLVSATNEELDSLESPVTELSNLRIDNGSGMQCLYAGCRYDFLSDSETVNVEWHVKSPRQMKKRRFVQLVCAMLNGDIEVATSISSIHYGVSSIHYGVTSTGRVFGIPVSRQQRDALTTGFDEALYDLQPRPLSEHCRISFTPVLNQHSCQQQQLFSLFVVSILCHPTDYVFTVISQNAVYRRFRLTQQQVRQNGIRYAIRPLTLPQVRHFVSNRCLATGRKQLSVLKKAADQLMAAGSCCSSCGLHRQLQSIENYVRKAVVTTSFSLDSESDSDSLEMAR